MISCQDCAWWDCEGGTTGACRHHAPGPGDGPAAWWPLTEADDWCGSHAAKAAATPPGAGEPTAPPDYANVVSIAQGGMVGNLVAARQRMSGLSDVETMIVLFALDPTNPVESIVRSKLRGGV